MKPDKRALAFSKACTENVKGCVKGTAGEEPEEGAVDGRSVNSLPKGNESGMLLIFWATRGLQWSGQWDATPKGGANL